MRELYAVFVAGGSGRRMGSDLPKQFLPLGEKTILEHTVLRFAQTFPSLHIIVVLPSSYMEDWKRICREGNFDIRQTLVEGGITRFHSVRNALERVPDGATVLIHDGVRPFVSASLLRTLAECPGGACAPVLPVTDTLKRLESSLRATEGPDPSREGLYAVQTPQVFHSELIKAAYALPFSPDFTDDASVARAAGIDVQYLPGEKFNIKITTPEDLEIARLYEGFANQ